MGTRLVAGPGIAWLIGDSLAAVERMADRLRHGGRSVSQRTAHTRVVWYGAATEHWVKLVTEDHAIG